MVSPLPFSICSRVKLTLPCGVISSRLSPTLNLFLTATAASGPLRSPVSERQQFVGEFTGERNGPLAAVAVKNKFSVGDSLELMTPQGNVNFTLEPTAASGPLRSPVNSPTNCWRSETE